MARIHPATTTINNEASSYDQDAVPSTDPNQPLSFTWPSWRTLAQWALCLGALYGVGWLLWQARGALSPFIIGLVLAFLLSPFVNRLVIKMPRWLAILTVYVGATVLIVISAAYLVPPVIDQTEQLIANIPTVGRLQQIMADLIARYRETVPVSIQEQLDPGIQSGVESVQANIGTIIQGVIAFVLAQLSNVVSIFTFMIGFLIIPIWLFYILNDQAEGRNFIDRLLHERIRADFWNTWNMISRVFNDYIRGQLVLCVAVGAAVGVGLLIVRLLGFPIEYILLLAILAGITEFIPVLGPIIGSIPGIIIAFLTAGPQGAVAALVVYVIVQQLENNFLVPRIVGESVGVHPAILTIVLIAMGQVFGLLGVVLSAPLAAISRDLFIYVYNRLGGAQPTMAMARVQQRTKVDHAEPRSVTGEVKAS